MSAGTRCDTDDITRCDLDDQTQQKMEGDLNFV